MQLTLPQTETVTDQSNIVQQEVFVMVRFPSTDYPFLTLYRPGYGIFLTRRMSFYQLKHLPHRKS